MWLWLPSIRVTGHGELLAMIGISGTRSIIQRTTLGVGPAGLVPGSRGRLGRVLFGAAASPGCRGGAPRWRSAVCWGDIYRVHYRSYRGFARLQHEYRTRYPRLQDPLGGNHSLDTLKQTEPTTRCYEKHEKLPYLPKQRHGLFSTKTVLLDFIALYAGDICLW
jgi:hypothetical protein